MRTGREGGGGGRWMWGEGRRGEVGRREEVGGGEEGGGEVRPCDEATRDATKQVARRPSSCIAWKDGCEQGWRGVKRSGRRRVKREVRRGVRMGVRRSGRRV